MTDTTFKGVKQFAQQAVWNLMDAHDAILEHRIGQTHYSNKCRQPGVKYQINDLVYLSTKNLTLPKHRARKLMPKFIGPYKILKAMNKSLNVTLELPQEFKDGKINPTFHMNLVRPYTLVKGVYSQLGNMHWKVDEHLKYLTNFLKRKYSLEI